MGHYPNLLRKVNKQVHSDSFINVIFIYQEDLEARLEQNYFGQSDFILPSVKKICWLTVFTSSWLALFISFYFRHKGILVWKFKFTEISNIF